jgi:hypothetical protein
MSVSSRRICGFRNQTILALLPQFAFPFQNFLFQLIFFKTFKAVLFTLAHFRCDFDESGFLNATPTFSRLPPSTRR